MDVNPDDLLWYYEALADLFVTERPGDMASELQDTVERLLDLADRARGGELIEAPLGSARRAATTSPAATSR